MGDSRLLTLACLMIVFVCARGVKQSRRLAHADRELKKGFKVECPAEIAAFTTYLYVTVMSRSRGITRYDLDHMEEIFEDSYSDLLDYHYCDLQFRELESVKAYVDEDLGGGMVRLLLVVEGECRGCDRNTKLFPLENTDSGSRTLQQQGLELDDRKGKKGKSCKCKTLNYGTPTLEETSALMRVFTDEYAMKGYLTTITGLVDVVELTAEACGASREFQTFVDVGVLSKVQLNAVLQGDLNVLRDGFGPIYNELQEGLCDPFARRIMSGEIVDVSRRLETVTVGRQLQERQRFNLRLSLAGFCLGCPKDVVFFNDAVDDETDVNTNTTIPDNAPTTPPSGRRFLKSSKNKEEADGPPTNLCFCPTTANVFRPPTEDEFTVEYNTFVVEQRNAGNIEDLVGVDEVIQVDETLPSASPSIEPTLVPSSSPTSAPSLVPSVLPTTEPSIKPTSGPSWVPSVKPSVEPSSAPSSAPTSTPSVEPTQEPTSLPSLSPTSLPSLSPTSLPSLSPTSLPSLSPTDTPSAMPTQAPSVKPSEGPTQSPSVEPSITGSTFPSSTPTTSMPSLAPSIGFRLCDPDEISVLVVDEDFENGNASLEGWENGRIDGMEFNNFSNFLGRYASGNNQLMPSTVFDVPVGADKLLVQFDLYEFDSWDGNSLREGPDRFRVEISSDTETDTFSFFLAQAASQEGPMQGVSENGLISWSRTSGESMEMGFNTLFADQKHTVTVVVPSQFIGTSQELGFGFVFETSSPIDNESGGLDNVRVEACFG